MDIADLYDYEIETIGIAWRDLMQKWSHRPNTKNNLQELAKDANDTFLKLGFVVNVRWENNLVINPNTMEPYPIEIEVLGRVPGTEDSDGYDHERKRHEVLRSKERGEDFYGQKEKATG